MEKVEVIEICVYKKDAGKSLRWERVHLATNIHAFILCIFISKNRAPTVMERYDNGRGTECVFSQCPTFIAYFQSLRGWREEHRNSKQSM